MPETPAPRAAEDRREIERLIAGYAHAVDDRSVGRILDCFASDAEIDYHGQPPVRGVGAIRAFFAAALGQEPDDAARTSTHLMCNTLLELAGDRAEAETEAVAFHAAAGRESVTIRGLRYSDRFVRTAGGWRVARRRHRCLWECSAPGALVPDSALRPVRPGS